MRKWLGLAVGIALASSWLAVPVEAAVICQKGNTVKFRPVECKPGWTELAAVGGSPADPSGIWEFESGTLFGATGLATRFLVLEPDGTGRLSLAPDQGGVLTCGPLHYARSLTPTLTLDLQSIGYLKTSVYRYDLIGGDELELRDTAGRSGRFARAAAVDPDAECGTLTEVTLFTGLPRPDQASGLGFDGTSLWYKRRDIAAIVPVNAAAGTAAVPLEFNASGFTLPHAYDDGAFWATGGGGGRAARVSLGSAILDQVDTATELGEQLNLHGIAFDPGSGHLWLFGFNLESQGRLFEVDPSPGGVADVLVEAFDLDGDITSLAFDGTHLWALHRMNQSLARIDPATGTAVANFKIPNPFAVWVGVAVVGNELALLGDTGFGGAILKLAIPPL
jgi:hypothetical protein